MIELPLRGSRRRAAALAAAVMMSATPLATPASGWAQSAGDEQYADPFAGQDKGAQQPVAKPQPQQQQAPSTQSPSGSGTQGTTVDQGTTRQGRTTDQTAATQPATGSAQTLPRTGIDVAYPAAIGVAFLIAGVLLWRRSAPPRRLFY